MGKVLLVGADAARASHLADRLPGDALQPIQVVGVLRGWEAFQKEPFHAVVVEMSTTIEGLELVRRIRSVRSRAPRVPVFVISEAATLSDAAAAGRAGATDFLAWHQLDLADRIARILETSERARPPLPYVLHGSSRAVEAARERIDAVAELDTCILVTGEPGTGHEAVVEYLHGLGHRANLPIHRVECGDHAEIPPDCGAVHLAEIHEFSSDEQSVWWKTILRSERDRESGPRIIASTPRDLRVLAAEKRFSPHLARELCRFEIWLPPLRERREDFAKIVPSLIENIGGRVGRNGLGISRAGIECLAACGWWDNFPELERAIESLVVFTPGHEITEAQAELVLLDSDPVLRATRERARREREELVRLLDECGANFSHMADRLKVDRGTIRYRLRKHGLLGPRR
jgi:DNA-binding NtrC family response regulator